MEIKKIVLTGGPGGGKTTALSRICERFSRLGWSVKVVSETASDFISGGYKPQLFLHSNEAWETFEAEICASQIRKECCREALSRNLQDVDKVLIVCDRGLLDNQAYMTEEQFQHVVARFPEWKQHVSTYDAVFHIVTAADGAEQYYTKKGKDGQEVRDEDIKAARELDLKLQRAWSWHPHYRITRNEEGVTFKQKVDKVISQIAEFLGEPVPYENERKFIIRYPDLTMLESLSNCQKQQIIQTYLPSSKSGEEVRVRRIDSNGWSLFTKTTKLKTETVGSRIETERNLSENDYIADLMTGIYTVSKTRYSIVLHESTRPIEVDIYPGHGDYAILEIEVPSMDSPVTIPGYLTVIREVTGDERFDNAQIAANGCRLPDLGTLDF